MTMLGDCKSWLSRITNSKMIWLKITFILTLMSIFVIGQFINRNTGWADNGDFRRVNQLFTDKPIGFEVNRPLPGTPEHELRYANYWLPMWNFKWGIPSLYSAFSSTILLWIPGALLNMVISQDVLFMVVLSIFPRLLIGISLLLILITFFWNTKDFFVWGIFFVLPLSIMLGSANYAAYFNSFYQEIGSITYLILFVIWQAIGLFIFPKANRIVGFVLLLLLTLAKSSNFYFSFLFLGIVFNIRDALKKPSAAVLILIISIATALFSISFVGERSIANRYNSLFYGVLLFSESPEERLSEIGIKDSSAFSSCKGSYYSAVGADCSQKYEKFISYSNVIRIILNEPSILYDYALRLGEVMQRTHIGLGQFAKDYISPYDQEVINFWAIIKEKYFPKNISFFVFLLGQLLILTRLRSTKKNASRLTSLNIGLVIACFVDMWIAILGDGVPDLVKHLLMANVLFDISTILTVTILVLSIFPNSGSMEQETLFVNAY